MKRGEFRRIAREIGDLVEQKNAAYGSSFANAPKILAVLFPGGIRVQQYADVLLIARILDKLQRIATDRDALGESPYRDIAGYGMLGSLLHEVLKGAREDAASVSEMGVWQRGEGQEQVLHGQVPQGAGAGGARGETEYLRIEEVPDVPPQPHWSAAWQARQDGAGLAAQGVPESRSGQAEQVKPFIRWREITSTRTAYEAARHQMEQVVDDALAHIARAEAARFDVMRKCDGARALTCMDKLWRVFADGLQISTYGWRTQDEAWIDAAASMEVPRG